jgi:hypothetical protein
MMAAFLERNKVRISLPLHTDQTHWHDSEQMSTETTVEGSWPFFSQHKSERLQEAGILLTLAWRGLLSESSPQHLQ